MSIKKFLELVDQNFENITRGKNNFIAENPGIADFLNSSFGCSHF